jgi:hypothetical protein
MRAGATVILLGLTALVAYSLGRQDAPTGKPSTPVVVSPAPNFDKPVARLAAPTDNAVPSVPQLKPSPATGPSQSDIKRKGEVALTAAAIAAILVQASRNQYYATGHPCACPDDLMRNGQRCGGRSAYSRPGGATPLCYPNDVSPEMIRSYQERARVPR